MPADKTFEEHMQQQLDALRIQPPASDWQQIHAALHPAKRRRIVWWWLPLAALLISGAIYLAKEPSGVAREGRNTAAKQTVAISEKTAVFNKEDKERKHNEPVGNDKEVITKLATENDAGEKPEVKNERQQQSLTTQRNTQQPAGIYATSVAKKTSRHTSGFAKNTTAKIDVPTNEQTAEHNGIAPADTVLPQSNYAILHDTAAITLRSLEGFHADAGNSLPQSTAPWPWMDEKIFTPSPRISTHRKWQTGWWAALGSTRLSQTAILFGTEKAAADFSSNNPGNVRYVSSRTEKNGQYFSAGWLLRKPMGKRWAFSTGLGAGLQSWQVSTSLFADSILPTGSLFNRSLTSTSDQQYRMLTLQVPMLLEWKLLGKQEGIWLQGGLNNQLLLQLREKQNLATVSQNFASTSNTTNVASKANGWQPQLRLGLVYQWQSKTFIHQMVPAVQLPLRSAFKTDDRGLLNIQLQYNMLWLRK